MSKMILVEEETVKQALEALVTYNAVAFSLNWESVNRVNKVIAACELALKQAGEPNLSRLTPVSQAEVREWIADGTFVERAVETMFELTQEVFSLKKQLQKAWQEVGRAVGQSAEPSAGSASTKGPSI